MKQSKARIARRRQWILILLALLLAAGAVGSGYYSFFVRPGLDADQKAWPFIVFFVVSVAALVMDLTVLAMLLKNIRTKGKNSASAKVDTILPTHIEVAMPQCLTPGITLGKSHGMGQREYQQDSFGQTPVLKDTGVLAVLADGMGGLSNGERVSQRIIMEALNFAVELQQEALPTALEEMVQRANQAVNNMLGPEGLNTSGSTVVSALIAGDTLWWVSIGDSRLYLYRNGCLNQLSRDHDLLQAWMPEILEGRRDLQEAMEHPDGRRLTSFIGMGKLRNIDRNHTGIPLKPGDRILLMSDGIYGTVSDSQMVQILRDSANVQDAASRIARQVRDAALPYQDNYTLVILGYDPSEPPNNRE